MIKYVKGPRSCMGRRTPRRCREDVRQSPRVLEIAETMPFDFRHRQADLPA